VGQVEATVLAAAVGQVAPAASTDHTLAVLTGVHTVLGPGGIVLSATDRYRLAQQTVAWEPTLDHDQDQEESARELLVPAATMVQAARAMTGTVQVGVETDQHGEVFALSDGVRALTTRLLDGDFPRADGFRERAGRGATLTVTVEAAALADAIGRVSLFAERHTPVRIELADDALVVRAGDDGDAGAEAVPAETAGETGWKVAFHPVLLSEALAGARCERVTLTLTTPEAPILVTPERDGDHGWQILMPIRQPTSTVAVAA
jgi:DNA polymerase-3 subunit beta